MTRLPPATVVENAAVMEPDRIVVRTIAFHAGRISERPTTGFRIDLRDHLIVPGLINAHDHLQLNNVPALRHDAPFPNSYAWIDAFESHLTTPEVLAATRRSTDDRHWHGALKNVLAGVTAVAHHDPWSPVFGDPDFPVALLQDFGWAHSLRLGAPRDPFPPRYGPPVSQSFRATSAELPWIIHLAEGVDDVAAAELSELESLGCLAANTVLVHGVGLSSADVERMIERGASLVWCPASNLAMFGRTVPARSLRRLFEAGRLTLGTDSRLTGSRDLLDELRLAAHHSDLSPSELLQLVTRDASRTLRWSGRGGLEPGQHGDCVIVRGGSDPYAAFLECGRSTIRAVVRAGAPVIADPDFAAWFTHCGVDATPIRVDGKPKLMARQAARPGAIALEPGVELMS